ncbi:hypothetical protein EII34_06215 [Arachnia propionica]|uniref:Uncharacterized protein n=1 Tax=Arachnia propionica TaxID=1750 RepID=A0A3P1T934_9ACTN|nr:hypothetical protein [Arachnia propionica]MDO5082245.1 hypothetical protein [Arachnia propionica]RRD05798.1 hypothetical protein EII34_06215 [Arachnia propionica]
MRRRSVIALVVAICLVAGLGFAGWKGWEWLSAKLTPERCYLQVEGAEEPLRLTHEQTMNAAIIVAESFNRELPEQAAVVALATAWQESGLRNLDHGDRDSLGLFQQRPSYGWGTEEQIMDPWYSSGRFYEEIVKFDNWETTDVNDMAQKVQRSGHPEAYRKHETNARALAGALRGTRPAVLACIDRDGSGSDTSGMTKVLAAVPGVEVRGDGTVFSIHGGDATTRWAAAQLAMAHTRAAGIKRITLGEQEWSSGAKQWGTTRSTPGESDVVVIALTTT